MLLVLKQNLFFNGAVPFTKDPTPHQALLFCFLIFLHYIWVTLSPVVVTIVIGHRILKVLHLEGTHNLFMN